jgi:hypothetical protein
MMMMMMTMRMRMMMMMRMMMRMRMRMAMMMTGDEDDDNDRLIDDSQAPRFHIQQQRMLLVPPAPTLVKEAAQHSRWTAGMAGAVA